MSGTLYAVATPIGNLEDITLRALRILREVQVVAAEDTRRTSRLLTHHAIATPTISFHAHNVRARVPQLIRRLERGESVALVTDAGTPGVSDPGLELVRACIEHGIPVDPLPGPSALLAAVVGSGFPIEPLLFLGFPPSKAKDRKLWLARVAEAKSTVVLFESPHRIRGLLTDLTILLGERPISVGRELTKLHQEFLRGSAAEVLATLASERGEFTVVIGPVINLVNDRFQQPAPGDMAAEFYRMTENEGLSRRAAISALARRHHLPAREIYSTLERAKSGLS